MCDSRYYYFTFPFLPRLLPPPPTATLFPYTTLFRSARQHPAMSGLEPMHDTTQIVALDADFETVFARFDKKHRHADRKSTRLNSSHLGISYAVFCLKKKKKKK